MSGTLPEVSESEIEAFQTLLAKAREECGMMLKNHIKGAAPAYLQQPIPNLLCKDGAKLSIQAGRSYYCSPKVDKLPRYSAFEVGWTADKDKHGKPLAFEMWSNEDDYIYGYVPVALIVAEIKRRGGFDRWEVDPTLLYQDLPF